MLQIMMHTVTGSSLPDRSRLCARRKQRAGHIVAPHLSVWRSPRRVTDDVFSFIREDIIAPAAHGTLKSAQEEAIDEGCWPPPSIAPSVALGRLGAECAAALPVRSADARRDRRLDRRRLLLNRRLVAARGVQMQRGLIGRASFERRSAVGLLLVAAHAS